MLISFEAIGRNIRAARKAKKLTQEQLAERLGISPLHYGRLERGQRAISLELLARMAQTLEISSLTLLNGCFTGEPLCAVPSKESMSFAQALARITAVCTPEERALILQISHAVCAPKTRLLQ